MTKEQIAGILLESKAVTLSPDKPYTYASGIKSPIYCDNRILLSKVEERRKLLKHLRRASRSTELLLILSQAPQLQEFHGLAGLLKLKMLHWFMPETSRKSMGRRMRLKEKLEKAKKFW